MISLCTMVCVPVFGDNQHIEGTPCPCAQIPGVENHADRCVWSESDWCIPECKQNACQGIYFTNDEWLVVCQSMSGGVTADTNGLCISGRCNCAPDINADVCKWEDHFCVPERCKKNYCFDGVLACEPGISVDQGSEGDDCDCATFGVEHAKKCSFKTKGSCLVCKPDDCSLGYVSSGFQCVTNRRITVNNKEMYDRRTNPGEYTIDPREYIDWGNGSCPPPYDKLLLMNMGSICTAEYIAPNIILTAQHCVVDNNNDIVAGRKIKYLDCKGNTVWASIKSYGDNAIYKGEYNKWGNHSVPVDWALLSVDDPKFYSSAMFGLKDVTGQHDITVDNAGWGAMPILSDKQIQELRQSFTEFVAESRYADFNQFDELFINTWDGYNLKAHKDCTLRTYFQYGEKQSFHSSTCYTWGGNSGGPYYVNNLVLGIVSGGVRNLPDQDVSDLIVSTVQYISQEQKNCEKKAAEAKWENNVCVCKDADKVWQDNKCECKQEGYVIGKDGKCMKPISQAQIDCEKVAGTQWDDDNSKCVCTDTDKVWRNNRCECAQEGYIIGTNGKCGPAPKPVSPEQKNCEQAAGTQWDDANNTCVCKDADKVWRNNRCECKQDGYIIGKDGECGPAPKPVSPEQKSCENDVAKRSGAEWNGSQCVCNVAGTSWNGEKCICPNPDETVQDGACKTSPRKQELDDAKKEIMDNCLNEQKLKTMSDYEFLVCLGRMASIKQLEENYKKAKEREMSFSNRMLGGLTMAATGIGGMELAMGLAEQKADEAAERDMEAYMATFQCKVGDKRYSGGTTAIETPGANQLTSLYQEYVELAADLKERKTALGMKAGIESEVILDKNNMGLYDDVGHGIENGTYASLYRAKMGNEKDIKKLEEQKDTSAKRVKGGAIAAGGGAVGGMAGNILINHTGDDDNSGTGFSDGLMDGLGGALGNAAGNVNLGDLSGVDASTVQSVMQKIKK